MMLLVVEDEPLLLRAVLRGLGDRPVSAARSATEARELALTRASWGGFIVDPGLPEGSFAGVELLGWLRARHPSAERVLVTAQPLEALAEAGARLGASLIAKPAALAEMIQALAPYDAKRSADSLAVLLECAAKEYGLTPREAGLLQHVAAGHRASSYPRHASIAPTTYKTHCQSVLAKTGASSVELFVIRLLSDELRRRRRKHPPRAPRG